MAECLCRTLVDRDGNPYIAGQEHCPLHAPRCSDMSTAEFARYIGRSINTVCRYARNGHPAARYCEYRKEYRWLPDVYRKTLEQSTAKPVQAVKKQRGPRARYAVVGGGK